MFSRTQGLLGLKIREMYTPETLTWNPKIKSEGLEDDLPWKNRWCLLVAMLIFLGTGLWWVEIYLQLPAKTCRPWPCKCAWNVRRYWGKKQRIIGKWETSSSLNLSKPTHRKMCGSPFGSQEFADWTRVSLVGYKPVSSNKSMEVWSDWSRWCWEMWPKMMRTYDIRYIWY